MYPAAHTERVLDNPMRTTAMKPIFQPIASRFFTFLAAIAVSSMSARAAPPAERITPLLLSVPEAPIPFLGSDGRTHLVYELQITNFSSGEATLQGAEVVGDGRVLTRLDTAAVAARLQAAGRRDASAVMAASTQALLFLHLGLPSDAPLPKRLAHRIEADVAAAPAGQQELHEEGGEVALDRRDVVVIGPPLRGERFIAADSCCDANRHTRAALPVNGRIFLAQRFAVDWEELDAQGRIYAGPQSAVTSYTIYGRDVLAVADARVVAIRDGLPDQPPGKMPATIAIEDADGNAIVLDLGRGHYALYAHLIPGSITVKPGERVQRGEVLGHVGNSGNSLAPHLHFHVMDTPSPLAARGLPYAIDVFWVTGATPGTEAFDRAEADGTPLTITPFVPPRRVRTALPLDQLEISFNDKRSKP